MSGRCTKSEATVPNHNIKGRSGLKKVRLVGMICGSMTTLKIAVN